MSEKRTGDLCDRDSGDLIREATPAEVIASRTQSWHDGGPGVIMVEGQRCYVEGDDDPELEICVSKEWVEDWLAARVEIDGEEYELECAADWSTTRLCELLAAADFQTTAAQGKRGTLAGWNRCQFWSFQTGPVGTFAELGDEEKRKIEQLVEQAVSETAAEWGTAK